jgi:hypothetical protein
MPTLRQEPGKLLERTWTTRGADGRKVRHTALGFDLTVGGKRERKFSSAWLTEQDVLAALARRRRELAGGIEAAPDWTLADLAPSISPSGVAGPRGGFEAAFGRIAAPGRHHARPARHGAALARYEHQRAQEVEVTAPRARPDVRRAWPTGSA